MDLSIIIPCYNEVENVAKIEAELLPVIVELAQSYKVELIFVDDGSTDDTWSSFKQALDHRSDLPAVIKFVRHPVNRGLGAALRTGFAAAQGELVVTTDSDGTYKFSEIPKLLAYLTSEVDMVTASPYHPKGKVVGVPGYRLMLSRGSSLIYRFLVDRRVHTYTALFRAYRREVITHVTCASDGYLAGTELLVKGMLRGYQVAEYPAVLHSRIFGISKAKLVRTILAHLRFQGHVLLHQLHLVQLEAIPSSEEVTEWA